MGISVFEAKNHLRHQSSYRQIQQHLLNHFVREPDLDEVFWVKNLWNKRILKQNKNTHSRSKRTCF